jgi:hypothetical protein
MLELEVRLAVLPGSVMNPTTRSSNVYLDLGAQDGVKFTLKMKGRRYLGFSGTFHDD